MKNFTKFLAGAAFLALAPLTANAVSIVSVTPDPNTTSANDLSSVSEFVITFDEDIKFETSDVTIHNFKYTDANDPFNSMNVAISGTNLTLTVQDTNGFAQYIEEGEEKGAASLSFMVNGLDSNCTSSLDNVSIAWGMATITYKYGDDSEGDAAQLINQGENGPFSIAYNTVWAFQPTQSGTLLIVNNDKTSNVAGSSGIVYTDASHTQAVASTNKADYSINGYTYTMEVNENEIYYVYFNNISYMGTFKFTFYLNYEEETDEPDPVDFVAGEPTTLLKGQKGNIEKPAEITSGTIEFQVVVNTTEDLGTFFYGNISKGIQYNTKEIDGDNAIYTFSNYAAWGPWWIIQNVEDELTFTVTFPQLAPTEVELDQEFSAEEGKTYMFTVNEAMILDVKSSVALKESQWYNMLYNNPGLSNAMTCETKISEDAIVDNVTYRLSSAGNYYLKAPVDAEFTLSKLVVQEKDPFEAEASLLAPLEGTETAGVFIVTWEKRPLDPSLSLMTGAKITNPAKQELTISRINITSSSESVDSSDAVSLGIDNDQISEGLANIRGIYTVYLPEGFAYDTEGNPSPETTLEYNLQPTAGDGELQYFDDSEITDNIPETYLLNSLANYVVTYPFELSYMSEDDYYIEVTVNGESSTAEIDGNTLSVFVGLTAGDENLDVIIKFPNGLFQNEAGDVNPPTTWFFTLYGTSKAATFDPVDGTTLYINDEKTVTVSWDDMFSFNNEYGDFENSNISLVGENGAVPLVFGTNVDFNEDFDGLVFDLSELEEGSYTITIPATSLVFAEFAEGDSFSDATYALNKLATATFIINDSEDESAIGSINVVNKNDVIYNLQGVKVDNNKLAKGLYIINGKKVMVK